MCKNQPQHASALLLALTGLLARSCFGAHHAVTMQICCATAVKVSMLWLKSPPSASKLDLTLSTLPQPQFHKPASTVVLASWEWDVTVNLLVPLERLEHPLSIPCTSLWSIQLNHASQLNKKTCKNKWPITQGVRKTLESCCFGDQLQIAKAFKVDDLVVPKGGN